ncbi:MAG: protease HtpX [Succinivibrionaceae bacterium]|nr:protease HtpX [Succinivibrionaceae bacterium]
MTRGLYYIATMLGVMVVFGVFVTICVTVFDINLDDAGGYLPLILICLFWGFAGSIVSLFMSKFMVKKAMRVQVIDTPSSSDEIWLVDTVKRLAAAKGVGMPEVGIYKSNEMNAFATGWSRNSSLVCVSTGLFSSMSRDECEAVLGHEMSHVANGDMVTSALLQGLLNSFVYFFSFIVASAIAGALSKNSRRGTGGLYYMIFRMVNSVMHTVFGVAAVMVQMKFSRWREYRADAGSAEVVGADKMISALQVLQRGSAVDENLKSVRAMCISDPQRAIASLFASHPPLHERIAALKKLK